MNFFAFISYSRKDKAVANWLHKRLESYAYPIELVDKNNLPPNEKYIRPIFLDTKDLQVEVRPFTEEIKNSLENSKFLIVICSKNSARSSFVNREILYFLETHNNNSALIIPLFIDEVDDSVPPALLDTNVMQRHFPIYNSLLQESSESNIMAFYQVTSYMLGVRFSDLYNRYEIFNKKENRKRIYSFSIIIGFMALAIVMLGMYLFKARQLVNFEKRVFPAAVVFGYERNFLTPVINYLKEESGNFKIFIMMPSSERDLEHRDRITDIVRTLKNENLIDSVGGELLPTSAKRGSRVMRLYKDGKVLPNVYVDFASTTTSFLEIAKYKKENEAYYTISIDDMVSEYSNVFVNQTKKELEEDSIYVNFYIDKKVFADELKKFVQQ